MADAPWRCSECGTVNEPAANACRVCGRWPSVFDLESGAVDTETEPGEAPFPESEAYAGQPVDVEEPPYVEAPPYLEEPTRSHAHTAPPRRVEDVESERPETEWLGPEPPIPESPPGSLARRLGRLIVPLLVVIYVLISILQDR